MQGSLQPKRKLQDSIDSFNNRNRFDDQPRPNAHDRANRGSA